MAQRTSFFFVIFLGLGFFLAAPALWADPGPAAFMQRVEEAHYSGQAAELEALAREIEKAAPTDAHW